MYENTNWKKFGYNAHHMGHYLKHLKDKILKVRVKIRVRLSFRPFHFSQSTYSREQYHASELLRTGPG